MLFTSLRISWNSPDQTLLVPSLRTQPISPLFGRLSSGDTFFIWKGTPFRFFSYTFRLHRFGTSFTRIPNSPTISSLVRVKHPKPFLGTETGFSLRHIDETISFSYQLITISRGKEIGREKCVRKYNDGWKRDTPYTVPFVQNLRTSTFSIKEESQTRRLP